MRKLGSKEIFPLRNNSAPKIVKPSLVVFISGVMVPPCVVSLASLPVTVGLSAVAVPPWLFSFSTLSFNFCTSSAFIPLAKAIWVICASLVKPAVSACFINCSTCASDISSTFTVA